MGNSRLSDPLKRPAFRRLAISFAINEMGDWLGLIALSVLVFDRTDSAMATAALFLGTGVIPALLTPVVVARLERPPPRFVLPTIYAGEAAAFLGLALLADNFSLAAVVAVAAIDGALALTAKTLTRAVTAAMLEPEGELRAGNAILNVAFTGGAAVGPAAPGGWSPPSASSRRCSWTRSPSTRSAGSSSPPGRSPTPSRSRAGCASRSAPAPLHPRQRHLQRLIGVEAVALVFFSAVVPIEVVYAKETLGVSDTGYGVLLGSWGVGMLFGSLVFADLRRASLPLLLLSARSRSPPATSAWPPLPTLAVACVAAVLGGTGNGVQWVAMVSAVQELTTPRCRRG